MKATVRVFENSNLEPKFFFFIEILDIKWFNVLLTSNQELACVIPKCAVVKMCS